MVETCDGDSQHYIFVSLYVRCMKIIGYRYAAYLHWQIPSFGSLSITGMKIVFPTLVSKYAIKERKILRRVYSQCNYEIYVIPFPPVLLSRVL